MADIPALVKLINVEIEREKHEEKNKLIEQNVYRQI